MKPIKKKIDAEVTLTASEIVTMIWEMDSNEQSMLLIQLALFLMKPSRLANFYAQLSAVAKDILWVSRKDEVEKIGMFVDCLQDFIGTEGLRQTEKELDKIYGRK